MGYNKNIQNNLNNNIYLSSQQNNINDVSADESLYGVEHLENIEFEDNIFGNQMYTSEFADGNEDVYITNTNNEADNINADEIIISQLEAEIEKLKAEYNANQKGKGVAGAVGGFFTSCWNGITGKGFKDNAKVELDKKIELLEAAKADPTKLAAAYKAIMNTPLTDEIRKNSANAQDVANNLSIEEKQQIIDALKEQAASLSKLMQETKDDQGWFSKAMGGLNNVLGFGTNSIKATAQIEEFVDQVNALDPNDPDFAAKYQALTGEALSIEGINELLQGVSKVGDSKAAEAIMDYEETQASAKEIGCGIVTGLVTAACVIAAPFTGGASIALGAAVGGATTVLIKGTDTIGTSKKYSLEQGILDFGGGAINGAVTAMTLGTANIAGQGFSVLKGAGGSVAKQTAKQMVSGGLKNTAKAAFNGFGKAALNGAKIATISTTSNYMLNTVGTNALYEATGNYTKSEEPANIIQNEDGTYSIYYEITDSNTGDVITYEIETVDSLSQDAQGNLIKGNVLETSRANDFNAGDLAKQVAISAGTAAVGAGIGKFTGNIINPYATSMTNSVVLGNAAEIASDMTLSLGADYLIASAQAGEFVDKDEFFSWDRILGEGQNQIRGLLIGIASSKANGVDTVSADAVRAGFDGKTSVEIDDIPVKTDTETDIPTTNKVEGIDNTTTELPTIKIDDTSIPATQQEVVKIAGELILKENNVQKAEELLKAYGMTDAQITNFINETKIVSEKVNTNEVNNNANSTENNTNEVNTNEVNNNANSTENNTNAVTNKETTEINPTENQGMETKVVSEVQNEDGTTAIKQYTFTGKNVNGEDSEYIQEIKYNYNEKGEVSDADVTIKIDGRNIETYKVVGNKEVPEFTPTQIYQIQQVRENYAKEINAELIEQFPVAYNQFTSLFDGIATDTNAIKARQGDIYEVEGNIMYGRPKTIDSLGDKIVNKIKKGNNVPDLDAARKIVEDGIGTRLIVEEVNEENMQVITNRLCEEIENGSIEITEINNYRGENLPPYFTEKQIDQLKNAVTAKKKQDEANGIYNNSTRDFKVISGSEKKATKESGYTACQINVVYKNGALGEVQIRGREMDQLAEVEHIPYDTKQGKKLKPKYDNAVEMIKSLSDEDYANYQKYWQEMYAYAVKTERGIPCNKPELPNGIPEAISFEGLQKISATTAPQIDPAKMKKDLIATGVIDSSEANEMIDGLDTTQLRSIQSLLDQGYDIGTSYDIARMCTTEQIPMCIKLMKEGYNQNEAINFASNPEFYDAFSKFKTIGFEDNLAKIFADDFKGQDADNFIKTYEKLKGMNFNDTEAVIITRNCPVEQIDNLIRLHKKLTATGMDSTKAVTTATSIVSKNDETYIKVYEYLMTIGNDPESSLSIIGNMDPANVKNFIQNYELYQKMGLNANISLVAAKFLDSDQTTQFIKLINNNMPEQEAYNLMFSLKGMTLEKTNMIVDSMLYDSSNVLNGIGNRANAISKKNVEFILQNMEYQNKLPSFVDKKLLLSDGPGNITKEVYDDLTKLNYACDNNIPLEDVFAKRYNDVIAGCENSEVGDVFRDATGRLYIKDAKGQAVQLRMSAQKYLELFPPIQRFTSVQGQIGDCYLVSSIDNLYKNPTSRSIILSRFTENADGTISIKMNNTTYKFNDIPGAFKNSTNKNLTGSTGMRLLEEVSGYESIENKIAELTNRLPYLTPGSKEYKEALKTLTTLQAKNTNLRAAGIAARQDGGWGKEVYELFGLKDIKTENCSDFIKNLVEIDPSEWDKYIIFGGTKGTADTLYINKKLKIAECHAYNVRPYINENGKIIVTVTNPWNTSNTIDLSLSQFTEYFNLIQYTKVS